MKRYINVILVCAILVSSLCLIGSCKKSQALTACTGTIPSSASVGATLTFTSCNYNVNSYAWDFGDGSAVATTDTAIHIYTTVGTYTGSLTVTSGSSSSVQKFTITIFPNNFTFKGTSYTTGTVIASSSGATLAARDSTSANIYNLTFKFATLPTSGGSYAVISSSNIPVGNQLYAILNVYNPSTHNQTIYGSTGVGSVNATVTVTAGKIAVSLPAIPMVNINNAADTSTLSATLNQTQ